MRIAFGLALVGAACIYACGSSSSSTPGGSAGADVGAAGDNGSNGGNGSAGKTGGDAGTGNSVGVGDAGEGGAAGSGPVIPPIVSTAKPHAAGALVAGGVVAHSTHFTAVLSLGESPGGNRIMTSANHQLRSGVIGASQN